MWSLCRPAEKYPQWRPPKKLAKSLKPYSARSIFILTTSLLVKETLMDWTRSGMKKLLRSWNVCWNCMHPIKQALILRRISEDLYSDRNHFILELIQNADDAKYHENTSPILKFQLSRTQLVIECNEIGFTEGDVRTLCRINDSTKKGD